MKSTRGGSRDSILKKCLLDSKRCCKRKMNASTIFLLTSTQKYTIMKVTAIGAVVLFTNPGRGKWVQEQE